MIIPPCLVTSGIQNDLWARFVTLQNQYRIWTLTITNKAVRKPVEQGRDLSSPFRILCLIISRHSCKV